MSVVNNDSCNYSRGAELYSNAFPLQSRADFQAIPSLLIFIFPTMIQIRISSFLFILLVLFLFFRCARESIYITPLVVAIHYRRFNAFSVLCGCGI